MIRFDINAAYTMAKLSNIAYDALEGDPTVLNQVLLKELGFTIVGHIHDGKTDTQGFVAKNSHMAVIVFRGTTLVEQDIATDLRFGISGGFHEGFYKAFESVRDQVEEYMARLEDLPIITTGHSLGGALAVVTALSVSHKNLAGCYTFGSPPVCAERMRVGRVPIFRIINEGDIVPRCLDLDDIDGCGDIYKALEDLLEQGALLLQQSGDTGTKYLLAYVRTARPQIGSYCHVGDEILFDGSGRIIKNKTSVAVFQGAIKRGGFDFSNEHSILKYMGNIRAYIENSESIAPRL